MLDDILKEILEAALHKCIYDDKARRNKSLNKAKEDMKASEKSACYIVYSVCGFCYLILLLIIPFLLWLQGMSLLYFWQWGFLLHFFLVEIAILLARAVKKSPQNSLRQLLFIRYRVRPLWMHIARWLPLTVSLSILLYHQFLI